MVRWRTIDFAVLFIIVDMVIAESNNKTVNEDDKFKAIKAQWELLDRNETRINKPPKTRKVYRSTSSSSGERIKSGADDDSGQSLDMTDTSSTDSDESTKYKGYEPKSSEERKGWRKWHRKCSPCPEDMEMKWRDPRIKWICGVYQQARRSFKSTCMMYLRNCQDGTMFTKLHDHRCKDDPERYGMHFFYDYKVRLSDDSSDSGEEDTSSIEETEFSI